MIGPSGTAAPQTVIGKGKSAAPGAGASATGAGVAGSSWLVDGFDYSFDDAITTKGAVALQINGVTVAEYGLPAVALGLEGRNFDPPLVVPTGQSVSVVVPAPGGTANAFVNLYGKPALG